MDRSSQRKKKRTVQPKQEGQRAIRCTAGATQRQGHTTTAKPKATRKRARAAKAGHTNRSTRRDKLRERESTHDPRRERRSHAGHRKDRQEKQRWTADATQQTHHDRHKTGSTYAHRIGTDPRYVPNGKHTTMRKGQDTGKGPERRSGNRKTGSQEREWQSRAKYIAGREHPRRRDNTAHTHKPERKGASLPTLNSTRRAKAQMHTMDTDQTQSNKVRQKMH